MFGVGETELVIIVLFAFMLFGPDKLPGMGRTIGRALRQFRSAQEDFTQVVQAEVVDPMTNAMNDTGKKKPRTAGPDALGDDADIEGPSAGARSTKGETFAERKARLKAEREAREAAEAASAQEAAAEEAGEDVSPAEAGSEDQGPKDGEAADAAEQEEAPKPDTSAAALYAMTPRRRLEPKAVPEPDPEATANEAAASASDEAPEQASDVATEPAPETASTEAAVPASDEASESVVTDDRDFEPASDAASAPEPALAPDPNDAQGKEDGAEA